MAQLDTLGVTCGTTCIADNINVFRLGFYGRSACTFASVDHIFKSVNSGARSLSFLCQRCFKLFDSKDDQILYSSGLTMLFHLKHLLCVVKRAENTRHLRLVEDEIDLRGSHCIIKAHSCHVVMHARNERLGPLRSILGPNSTKTPHLAFSLDLRAELEAHHSSCQVLYIAADRPIVLPYIVAEDWSLVVCTNLGPSSKEGLIATVCHMTLETLQKCSRAILNEILLCGVIVEFWLDMVVD